MMALPVPVLLDMWRNLMAALQLKYMSLLAQLLLTARNSTTGAPSCPWTCWRYLLCHDRRPSLLVSHSCAPKPYK
mgnify:CR=1 FL=1